MKQPSIFSLYFNRRMLALVGLGFASGLAGPWGILGAPFQAWLIDCGLTPKDIGLAGLVALPFTFNFIAAPLLDRYVAPFFGKRFGRRRGWLLPIQLLIVGLFLLLAAVGPSPGAGETSVRGILIICVAIACFGALQDVMADAYRTDVLPDAELGAGAAVFVKGYRVAMLSAGALALNAAAFMPWPLVMVCLAAMMAIAPVMTLIAPQPEGEPKGPETLGKAVVEPFVNFFKRLGITGLFVLIFIVIYALPDAMANAMTMPLLLDELQFTKTEVGTIRQGWGVAMLLAGALAGGVLVSKIGVWKSLWVLAAFQMLSNFGLVLLTIVGAQTTWLFAVVTVENFSAGMVTSGFIAYLMSLCDRRYSATQYALFTSLKNFMVTSVAATSGWFVESLGYAAFFTLTAAAGIPALVLLAFLRNTVRVGEEGKEDQAGEVAASDEIGASPVTNDPDDSDELVTAT